MSGVTLATSPHHLVLLPVSTSETGIFGPNCITADKKVILKASLISNQAGQSQARWTTGSQSGNIPGASCVRRAKEQSGRECVASRSLYMHIYSQSDESRRAECSRFNELCWRRTKWEQNVQTVTTSKVGGRKWEKCRELRAVKSQIDADTCWWN